jgi:predicted O-methyltransferase YrrM
MLMKTNFYDEKAPDVARVLDAPASMRLAERLMIYALVVGLEPGRVLEIGTARGGTAWIIVQAMNHVGHGRLVCVDPDPLWDDELQPGLSERAVLVRGRSPEAIPECAQVAGGNFDMALIDGDHSYHAVTADIDAVMPHLAAGGRLLFHDWNYEPVAQAIYDALERWPSLSDAGPLTMKRIARDITQAGVF